MFTALRSVFDPMPLTVLCWSHWPHWPRPSLLTKLGSSGDQCF